MKNTGIEELRNVGVKLQKGTVATAYSEYGKGTVEIKKTGKNLLPNNAISEIKNGLTITVNEDKSISINGTATAYTTIYLCQETMK